MRTETGIAVLALEPSHRLAEPDFFREVYGFDYDHARHRNILGVLVHRMRAGLEEVGSLERSEGTLALELHEPVLLPDPRCALPVEERVLRLLVREGGRTAKKAARRLGVSVRTVQIVLQQLHESGACRKERRGRSIEYALEDTTFKEPTQTDVEPT